RTCAHPVASHSDRAGCRKPSVDSRAEPGHSRWDHSQKLVDLQHAQSRPWVTGPLWEVHSKDNVAPCRGSGSNERRIGISHTLFKSTPRVLSGLCRTASPGQM